MPGFGGNNSYFPGGGTPSPSPMSVPGWEDFAAGKWSQVPAYLPTLTLPTGPSIGLMPRDRPLTFTFSGAATTPNAFQFDIPTTVFALTAACVTTDGSGLPVGRSSLDMFRIQLTRSNGDKFTSDLALGSTICGTAANPRLIGPSGWMFNNGSTMQVLVQNLFAVPVSIDIVCYSVEVRGPFNFGLQALPYGNVG